MKNIILILNLFISSIFFAQTVEHTLQVIPTYYQTTVFDDTTYSETTWQEFYQRKDILTPIDYKNIDLGLLNACMLYATNKIRAKYNKAPLAFQNQLRDAAMIHSYNMVKQNFFSHENPKPGIYKTMKSRIEANKYFGEGIAENIYKGFLDTEKPKSYIALAEEAINRFYSSPEHKANMLNPKYTECGQACYFYSSPKDGYIYYTVTQNYGYPWKE
jgi:uncharacterized protein YkwD